MPIAAPKPCNKNGCPNLTQGRYCDDHKDENNTYKKQHDSKRPNANQRGYGAKWRKARAIFLMSNPLCENHAEKGQTVRASVVDHRIPHKGDMILFWDQSNWQSLCKRCHDKKTATQDGGIGSYMRGDN